MAFSRTSYNIRLSANGILSADCMTRYGSLRPSRINLNDFIGNRDGSFDIGGFGFASTTRDMSISRSLLSTDLQTNNGNWIKSTTNLDRLVSNINGHLCV